MPLVQQFFGIHPFAVHKRVVLEPHFPTDWENASIENLPIGANTISFSRTRTGTGIEYAVNATESGWTFDLKGIGAPNATYYLNGRRVASAPSGIRLSGRKNLVLAVAGAGVSSGHS